MGLLPGLMSLLLLVHGGMSRQTDCNNDNEICRIAANVDSSGTNDFSKDAVVRLSCAFTSKNVVIYTDPAKSSGGGDAQSVFDERTAKGAEGHTFQSGRKKYHIWVFDSGTVHPGTGQSTAGDLNYFPPASNVDLRQGHSIDFGQRTQQQQQCSSQTGESTTRMTASSTTATHETSTTKRRATTTKSHHSASTMATMTESGHSTDSATVASITTSAASSDATSPTPSSPTSAGQTSSSRAGALGALPLPSAAAVAVGLAALWL